MNVSFDKEKSELRKLIINFRRNEAGYCRSGSSYNETQLRKDFVEPFFEILGWDVTNTNGLPQNLREVAYEGRVNSGDESRPDYAFTLAGKRKFFVETKKPSVPVERDSKSALQLRSYGWSAELPISILTNFRYLIIYDCKPAPREEDTFRIGRVRVYRYSEYEHDFEEIHELLSRKSVYSGLFDMQHKKPLTKGILPFDEYLLTQIDNWRKRLAKEMLKKNPAITEDELNYVFESFINRIVFLRICEDREIEKYQTLIQTANKDTRNKLLDVFRAADTKYDSGIFDFRKDTISLRIAISDDTLIEIIKDLYYPRSPYKFSVVDSHILGQIYELFLTKKIVITNRKAKLVTKPEIAHDLGIVSTPRFVVEEIVNKAIGPFCRGKEPGLISKLKFADPACGSGSFLLETYNYLLNNNLNFYVGSQDHSKIYRGEGDTWYLTIEEKKRILTNNIFGIDIDPSAVEVTKFSLLVRLLQDETASSVQAIQGGRILPSLEENIQCGNSLVDKSFFSFKKASELTASDLDKLKAFDWNASFKFGDRGGFDAILGNPPYTRIQVMKKLFPLELKYYQQHYDVGRANNFDKYYLFVECALSHLNNDGIASFIIPHKFMKIKAGEALRRKITEGNHLQDLVHFGKEQVFEGSATTYTCMLTLCKVGTDKFKLELVKDLHTWKYDLTNRQPIEVKASEIGSSPWLLIVGPMKCLVERFQKLPKKLSDIADIFVGLQTSMDKVYIVKPQFNPKSSNKICFKDFNGKEWQIERGLTRPAIYDLIITPYMTIKPNSRIIYPYYQKGGHTLPYSEVQLKSKFPLGFKYLSNYKKLLEKRNMGGSQVDSWFRYGRSQSLAKFDGRKKLIVKVLSLAPCFTYDSSNVCFTGGGNGPYYGVSLKGGQDLSEHFIQGILNSKLIDLFVKNWSSVFRAGYYSYGKEYIENLPIVSLDLRNNSDKHFHDQIVKIVNELISLEQKLGDTKIPSKRKNIISQESVLKEELNETVYELYKLTENEKTYLRNLSLE